VCAPQCLHRQLGSVGTASAVLLEAGALRESGRHHITSEVLGSIKKFPFCVALHVGIMKAPLYNVRLGVFREYLYKKRKQAQRLDSTKNLTL
jgi:hypothetical protein